MKHLYKKFISLFLVLALLLAAAPAALASENGTGAASPPPTFSVYLNVDGCDTPTLLKTYTSTDMRNLAKQSQIAYLADETYDKMTDDGSIYYTALNAYYSLCGRSVTEYIRVSDFLQQLGVSLGEADYLIMGEDYTIDPQYSEYNFGSAEQNYSSYWKNYGWYSYDDLFASRYYFQNWKETAGFRVPAVLALRSYGGTGWSEETYWEMYAGSSDYLWAYVINFGQKTPTEANYNRFYYQQTQCTLKLSSSTPAAQIVLDQLTGCQQAVQQELDTTLVGGQASEIPEGAAWVTQAQMTALQEALAASQADAATNGEVYSAYLTLQKALEIFRAAKQTGTRTGYAWFSAENYERTQTFTISSLSQLVELANLVDGTAEVAGELLPAYSFEGKTVQLSTDLDLERYRITIGSADHPFAGTFDGQQHTISNLRISGAASDAALFGCSTGVVENLTLTGLVSTQEPVAAAGIVALNRGAVRGCVSKVTVDAPKSTAVGGVTGRNEGVVENCLNTGAVTGLANVGGIAGYCYGGGASVAACMNAGAIAALQDSGNTNAGGIVGGVGTEPDAAVRIASCIHTGTVTTAADTAGGIVGGAWIAELTVENSYSIGTVQSTNAGAQNIGALLGRSKATLNNAFWLTGTAPAAIGYSKAGNGPAASTAAELMALTTLGDAFRTVENGWPVLGWQSVYQVGFDTEQRVSVPAQSIGEWMPAVQPADPAATGCSFDGWCADVDRQNAYDFTQLITGNTTVYARFAAHRYDDVSADAWYAGAVDYVTQNGLMNGVGGNRFAPQDTMNRAMVVTVLYRMAGSPAVTQAPAFADVAAGKWYTNAIGWASANGIVKGYSADRFAPMDAVTREQLTVILQRYAKLCGYDVSQQAALDSYADADAVSGWAQNAMRWALATGLIQGRSQTTLAPAGTATRAEVATILMRFQNVYA